jgi:hypothetical protein
MYFSFEAAKIIKKVEKVHPFRKFLCNFAKNLKQRNSYDYQETFARTIPCRLSAHDAFRRECSKHQARHIYDG